MSTRKAVEALIPIVELEFDDDRTAAVAEHLDSLWEQAVAMSAFVDAHPELPLYRAPEAK